MSMLASALNFMHPAAVTYATLDPAHVGTGITLSNGNLTASVNGSSDSSVFSTLSKSSGKWYWEIHIDSIGTDPVYLGTAASLVISTWLGNSAQQLGYKSNDGKVYTNGTGAGTAPAYAAGNTIGIAVDVGGNKVTFYKNNSTDGGTYSVAGGTFLAGVGFSGLAVAQVTFNFGASPFTYSPPAGYNTGLYQ